MVLLPPLPRPLIPLAQSATVQRRKYTDVVKVVLRHFHQHCYKSSPLLFIVGGTKALVRLS
jgi:hypothetical protein